jgi:uncharacterized membrane protein YgcG
MVWKLKTVQFCLLLGWFSILSGCGGSQNAHMGQVLPGYQPELDIDRTVVDSVRKGPNEFTISLRKMPEVETQKNETWCWAASTAALLNYDHVPAKHGSWTQDDIIRKLALHKSDQSGGESDVLVALSPELQADFSKAVASFQARPSNENGHFDPQLPRMPDAGCLVNELAEGRPVIVAIDPDQGLLGHVVVATGVRFSMASNDVAFGSKAPYFIREIQAIDPRDGKPTTFSAFVLKEGEEKNAIDRVAFAASRPLAKDYVKVATADFLKPKWVANDTSSAGGGGGGGGSSNSSGSHSSSGGGAKPAIKKK